MLATWLVSHWYKLCINRKLETCYGSMTGGTAALWVAYYQLKSGVDPKHKHTVPLVHVKVDAETAFLVYSIVATVLAVSIADLFLKRLKVLLWPCTFICRCTCRCSLLVSHVGVGGHVAVHCLRRYLCSSCELVRKLSLENVSTKIQIFGLFWDVVDHTLKIIEYFLKIYVNQNLGFFSLRHNIYWSITL